MSRDLLPPSTDLSDTSDELRSQELARSAEAEADSTGEATNLVALIESLLFVADEPLTVSRLTQTLEVTPAEVEEALNFFPDCLRRPWCAFAVDW